MVSADDGMLLHARWLVSPSGKAGDLTGACYLHSCAGSRGVRCGLSLAARRYPVAAGLWRAKQTGEQRRTALCGLLGGERLPRTLRSLFERRAV